MLKITQSEYDKISKDYKGIWSEGIVNFRGDIPREYIGKRTVLEGCITGQVSARLLTEGIHFEIV